ncbi:MAG: mevalonate kinase [Candidatus ainarchaeum sp.]|nr:mevalonate kinase [Candidatus ainarchaeum sp.]MDD5096804.1 mevalonate kinase [Candidatus ainarchaeum sp.]
MGFEGTGYGKAILIGEHFVVHGARGIGIGMPRKTTVTLEKAPSLSFSFECGDLLKEATRRVLEKVAGGTGFKVSVTSEFPVSAGMGWSASYCVALARAAAAAAGRELGDREAAKAAFEGERAFHGNPSGIDNALAAHGGVMLFKRGREPEPLAVGGKFHFVIANSGKKGPTKELVGKVSSIRAGNPSEYGALEEAEEWLIGKAIEALARGDAKALGKLMDENNELLARLGLSTPIIDDIRGVALENGALGAKITGAGGGGCVLILAPDAGKAGEIADKLGKYGAFGFLIE